MIHIKKIDLNIFTYYIYKDMTCHPKNAFYVRRWRDKYRDQYLFYLLFKYFFLFKYLFYSNIFFVQILFLFKYLC